MSEREFSIEMLEKKPTDITTYVRKKGFATRICESALKQDGEFFEVKLSDEHRPSYTGRALGRVIKEHFIDKLEYLGRNDEKNAVYLKKIVSKKGK